MFVTVAVIMIATTVIMAVVVIVAVIVAVAVIMAVVVIMAVAVIVAVAVITAAAVMFFLVRALRFLVCHTSDSFLICCHAFIADTTVERPIHLVFWIIHVLLSRVINVCPCKAWCLR